MRVIYLIKKFCILLPFTLIMIIGFAYAEEEADDEDDAIEISIPKLEAPPQGANSSKPIKSLSLEGKVSGLTLIKNSKDYDVYALRPRVDVQMKKTRERSLFIADLRVQSINDSDSSMSEFIIREAYGTFKLMETNGTILEFTMGKKIFSMGKLDEFRIVDIVSPQDYRLLTVDELNDRKIGSYTIGASMTMAGILVDAFIIPYAKVNKTALEPTESGIYSQVLADANLEKSDSDPPKKHGNNREFLYRLAFATAGIDLEFLYFDGYYKYPSLRLTYEKRGVYAVPVRFQDTYPRVKLNGLSFETTLPWGLGLRGEAAKIEDKYFSAKTQVKSGGLLIKDEIAYGVGIDKNDLFFKNFYLNIQYAGSRISGELTGLDRTKREIRALTFFADYSFLNEKIMITNSLYWGLTYSESIYNPEISYQIDSEAKINLGFLKVDSSEHESELAYPYRDSDSGYLKFDYYF